MSERLNVIALISGGKDSFYSLLHCLRQGHRVIALANLFPHVTEDGSTPEIRFVDPDETPCKDAGPGADQADEAPSTDLNSFMYQTVGHEIIHLYAAATGIPLYRLPVRGGAVHQERDYDFNMAKLDGDVSSEEAESMYPLLQHIKNRHPEANAVSAGAILSSYQRTRVESVALRLGLVPLAYLWKYSALPSAVEPPNETQLLEDMAVAGLEARIVKVASAGLDDSFLWQQITSTVGAERVKRALRRFGAGDGAALGEGGEFETVVLDGPAPLFKNRIVVPADHQTVIREGGGSFWLKLRQPYLEEKPLNSPHHAHPRTPELLESHFQKILEGLVAPDTGPTNDTMAEELNATQLVPSTAQVLDPTCGLKHLAFRSGAKSGDTRIEEQTRQIVEEARRALPAAGLEPTNVTSTVAILGHMSQFPTFNAVYSKLFPNANPPSRVTISCGNLLPDGCKVLVYMTVPSTHPNKGQRQGLHVQSRSYWAPANIGPYSQAIEIPIATADGNTALRSVTVAGQIPLIPATMQLPEPSDSALQIQIVLSLQHLWRIGREMNVQFWTGAVAFFARASNAQEMQKNARLARRAWKAAHGSPDDEDATEDGPDPWDLKYNPAFMTMGDTSATGGSQPLPDWSVVRSTQREHSNGIIPPFFAVEVEELPRTSSVEWQAHCGLSNLDGSSVEIVEQSLEDLSGWAAKHLIARTDNVSIIYTSIWKDFDDAKARGDVFDLGKDIKSAHHVSIRSLGIPLHEEKTLPSLVYLDLERAGVIWPGSFDAQAETLPLPIIPCRSIWSSAGERCGILALFSITIRS